MVLNLTKRNEGQNPVDWALIDQNWTDIEDEVNDQPIAFDEEYNVLRFGADRTGVEDCYDAFQECLTACRAAGHKRMVIPAGTYLCTQPGLFDMGPGVTNGLAIVGAGMGATIVRFINSDGTTLPENNYCYTNTNTDLRINFHGIRFEGDSTNKNSRFCYVTSSSQAQSIRFWDCMWYQWEGIVRCEGSANASEMLYFGCKASNIYGVAFHINNVQSVNHSYYGCDFEVMLDDIWLVDAGGHITVFGGSLIMGGDGLTTGAVLHLSDTSGSFIGFNNWTQTFNGVRTELKDDSQFLNGQGQGQVNLYNSNTEVITGTSGRIIYAVYDGLMFNVSGGHFDGKVYLQAVNASAYANGNRPATIFIRGCTLGGQFEVEREDVTNKGGRGKAIIERCKPFSQATGINEPLDQIMGWDEGSQGFAICRRIAILHHNIRNGGLPLPTGQLTLKLPLGALITNLRIWHPGEAGTAGQVYYLKNEDASTTLETWTFDIANDQIAYTVMDYLCDSDNNRTLIFTGDAANTATSYTGFLEVEYLA